MSERTLICATCSVILVVVRDGKVRKDVVVYCKCCDPGSNQDAADPNDIPQNEADIPDFMARLFGGRGRGW